MRPYAVLTVLLYTCTLFVLAVPAAQLFYGWEIGSGRGGIRGVVDAAVDLVEICTEGHLVVWVLVMAAGQGSLLLIPLARAERGTPHRKEVLITVVAAALFLSLLDASAMLSIALAVLGDRVFVLGGWILVGFLVLWVIWTMTFYSFSMSPGSEGLSTRIAGWLFAGGIIAIMAAVPCYLITRVKDVIVAPDVIFLMIVLALWTALMALGPWVFSLFVRRYRRLNPDE